MNLSIIIPALGSQADIDSTVLSVLENRPPSCEVLMVHPTVYQDPYQLDDELRLVASDAGSQWALLNEGIQQANGRIVHTLLPGTTVSANWCDPVVECFDADNNLGSVSPAILVGKSKRPIVGIGYRASTGRQPVRRKKQIIGPTIEGGFYLRSAVQFMKGFHTPYAGLADIDLALRLRSANYRWDHEPDCRLHVKRLSDVKPPRGYQAGRIRGELNQRAKQMRLVSAPESFLATITEPFRNGIGPGIVTGILGRCLGNICKPSPEVHSISDDPSSKKKQRSAA